LNDVTYASNALDTFRYNRPILLSRKMFPAGESDAGGSSGNRRVEQESRVALPLPLERTFDARDLRDLGAFNATTLLEEMV
jgi:hypothetical protein